jgi:hypothetical protein
MTEEEILNRARKIKTRRLEAFQKERAEQERLARESLKQKLHRDIAATLGLPDLTDKQFRLLLDAFEEYKDALE